MNSVTKATIALSLSTLFAHFALNRVYTTGYLIGQERAVFFLDKNGEQEGEIVKAEIAEVFLPNTWKLRGRKIADVKSFYTANCTQEDLYRKTLRTKNAKGVVIDLPTDDLVVLAVCTPRPHKRH